MRTWGVTAQNLPEHANNPIHTDAGARAAGFPAALVAGVTTYAYLTHPVAAAWGERWLAAGTAEVRFHAPVFAGDDLRCVPVSWSDTDALVEARVGTGDSARATLAAGLGTAATPPASRPGAADLPPLEVTLRGELGAGYGARAGEAPDLYGARGWVHPAVWPALANRVVHLHVARGSWIHTRSTIRHHAVALEGADAVVHAAVVDRQDRPRGERAVLDVTIHVGRQLVATIEHEAYVSLH